MLSEATEPPPPARIGSTKWSARENDKTTDSATDRPTAAPTGNVYLGEPNIGQIARTLETAIRQTQSVLRKEEEDVLLGRVGSETQSQRLLFY